MLIIFFIWVRKSMKKEKINMYFISGLATRSTATEREREREREGEWARKRGGESMRLKHVKAWLRYLIIFVNIRNQFISFQSNGIAWLIDIKYLPDWLAFGYKIWSMLALINITQNTSCFWKKKKQKWKKNRLPSHFYWKDKQVKTRNEYEAEFSSTFESI